MKLAILATLIFASASPAFKTSQIKIADKVIEVELAETSEQQALGLMFRNKLDDGKGMLFVFKDSQPRSFWMKNTLIPLSIAFIDASKKIIDIQDMKPGTDGPSAAVYVSRAPAQYALEVPQGWFAKNKIQVGHKFRFLKK